MLDFLKEDFERTGSDLEEFKRVVEYVDSKTTYKVVPSTECIDLSTLMKSEDGNLTYRKAACVWEDDAPFSIPETAFVGENAELLKEHRANGTPLIRYRTMIEDSVEESPLMFCRPVAVNELDFLCTGNHNPFARFPSPERDALITRELLNAKKKATLCIRSADSGASKLLSVRSGQYKPLPQRTVVDIFEAISTEMGEKRCRFWSIDHDFTTLYVEFPELAEYYRERFGLGETFVPGIKIVNSGMGYSRIRAVETWTVDGITFEISDGSESKEHSGSWEFEAFLEDCKKSIFKEYTVLPETLCKLWDIDIIDADTPEDEAREALSALIKSIFKQINLGKAFGEKEGATGKKRKIPYSEKVATILEDWLTEEYVASGLPVTAYDVCTCIMTLPNRVEGIMPSYVQPFKNACGKAFLCEYKIKKKDEDDADEEEIDIALVG